MTNQMTRRALLASAPCLAATTCLAEATVGETSTLDPILGWHDEYKRMIARYNKTDFDTDAAERAASDAFCAIEDRIVRATPQSAAGAAAQLEICLEGSILEDHTAGTAGAAVRRIIEALRNGGLV